MPTAVVIDGALFLRRFNAAFPNLAAGFTHDVAFGVICMAAYHVAVRAQASLGLVPTDFQKPALEETNALYRVFFHDRPPLTKRLHTHDSKRSLHLGSTPEAKLRLAIHAELHATRKVAIRLGRLNEKPPPWRLKSSAVDRRHAAGFTPQDDDFELDVIRKGVDMRLGLDIAAMAYKRRVDQIVLVAADADFVPAAKLARREGIDVVLDPMSAHAAPDLMQHVDGVRNCHMSISPFHRNAHR